MKKSDGKKGILSIIAKLLYYIVISFACLIALFLVYYIISSQLHGNDKDYKPRVSLYTIVSPSMTPNINVYDVVVNIRVDNPSDIQVGDIITYKSQAATSEGMTITHRVIAKNELQDGTFEYLTQGDNNASPDSVYVKYNDVIGREVLTIPYLGKIQFVIANQKGWLFLLLIPIGIYLIREALKLIDLLGLRKKVNKVIGVTEDGIIERTRKEKIKQVQKEIELKQQIREDIDTSKTIKASKLRNNLEQEGSLEKYSETIVSVKKNKYSKYLKDYDTEEKKELEKEVIVEKTEEPPVIVPTKVDIKNIVPKEEKKKEEIILPKRKTKPEPLNQEYEILDTDDITNKIKEYDKKISKIDKVLKDIDNLDKTTTIELPIIEYDEFLTEEKIKVIKVEETKNKKQPKTTTKSKKNSKNTKDVKSEEPKFEDIVEKRKRDLNPPKIELLKLNPKDVKKINRKPKKKTVKKEPNLTLNPKNVKKINRPNKKKKVD